MGLYDQAMALEWIKVRVADPGILVAIGSGLEKAQIWIWLHPHLASYDKIKKISLPQLFTLYI